MSLVYAWSLTDSRRYPNDQAYIKPVSRARTAPAREAIAMSQTSEVAATVGAAAKPASPAAAAAHRWWILATAGIAQLMVILDATVVNIALPTAQRNLGFSNADRQWVNSAVLVQAEVHSYATAYRWAAVFFLAGLVITALLYRASPERSGSGRRTRRRT